MVLRSLVVLALLSSTASAQSIGVYTNVEGTECVGTTTNGILEGSVWVNLGGAAEAGFVGAQFRIDVLGNGRFDDVIVYPEVVHGIVLGKPFRDGTTIAYPGCQTAPRVRLMTFTLVATAETRPLILGVRQHARHYPEFTCPQLVLCDGPVFTHVCLDGNPQPSDPVHRRAVVNTGRGVVQGCAPRGEHRGSAAKAQGSSVRMSSSSWGGVKSLYKQPE